jgi:palmitoyltransferase
MKWNWKRVVGLLAPAAVLAIACYVYFVVIVVVCHDFYAAVGLWEVAIPIGLAFNICFIDVVWSYLACAFTPAGRVPDSWTSLPAHMVASTEPGVPPPPFCIKCQKYKPERTHHCSSCEEYVFMILVKISRFTSSVDVS